MFITNTQGIEIDQEFISKVKSSLVSCIEERNPLLDRELLIKYLKVRSEPKSNKLDIEFNIEKPIKPIKPNKN